MLLLRAVGYVATWYYYYIRISLTHVRPYLALIVEKDQSSGFSAVVVTFTYRRKIQLKIQKSSGTSSFRTLLKKKRTKKRLRNIGQRKYSNLKKVSSLHKLDLLAFIKEEKQHVSFCTTFHIWNTMPKGCLAFYVQETFLR